MLDVSTVGRQAVNCGLSRALWSQQNSRGKLGGPLNRAETDCERVSRGEGWRLQAVCSVCDVGLGVCQGVGCFLLASRWQCLNFMSAVCRNHKQDKVLEKAA